MQRIAEQNNLDTLCKEVQETQGRVFFECMGEKFVLMSQDDYDYLDALEDARLNKIADASLEEPGESIPYEQIRKKMGLNH